MTTAPENDGWRRLSTRMLIIHPVQELIRLWRENLISDEVLHKIEEHLDYQESRI